jgi:hypothetical protein
MESNSVMFIDEFNLATSDVQNCVMPVLDTPDANECRGPIVGPIGDQLYSEPLFRVIAAQNPVGMGMIGRQAIPSALQARFVTAHVTAYTKEEIQQILVRVLEEDFDDSDVVEKYASAMSNAFHGTNVLFEQNCITLLTVRMLMKWIGRARTCNAEGSIGWQCCLLSLLKPMLAAGDTVSCFEDATRILSTAFSDSLGEHAQIQAGVAAVGPACTDGYVTVKLGKQVTEMTSEPQECTNLVAQIAIAVKCNEPMLIIGPTSHKRYAAHKWADVTHQWSKVTDGPFVDIHLTSETQVSDLIGSVRPFSVIAAIEEFVSCITVAIERLSRMYGEDSAHAIRARELLRSMQVEANSSTRLPVLDILADASSGYNAILGVLCNWYIDPPTPRDADKGFYCILRKCKAFLRRIKQADNEHAMIFLFADGPLSKAIKAVATASCCKISTSRAKQWSSG